MGLMLPVHAGMLPPTPAYYMRVKGGNRDASFGPHRIGRAIGCPYYSAGAVGRATIQSPRLIPRQDADQDLYVTWVGGPLFEFERQIPARVGDH